MFLNSCISLYKESNTLAATKKVIVIPIEKIHPNDHPEIQDRIEAKKASKIAGIANIPVITLIISAQYIILDKTSFILKV
tara:strand:+ start:3516 stop:3755 length:240 start_codon:yes stop_codon:yes gene_type:complete